MQELKIFMRTNKIKYNYWVCQDDKGYLKQFCRKKHKHLAFSSPLMNDPHRFAYICLYLTFAKGPILDFVCNTFIDLILVITSVVLSYNCGI